MLLEMEGGAWYARVSPEGPFESTHTPVFDGTPLTLTPGSGLATVVEVGSASFEVVCGTELGGASLIGRAPDGSVLLVLDEIVLDAEGAIELLRRVQRYAATGALVGETPVEVEQYVDIARTLEMTADGRVALLVTHPERVEIRILDP